jgi:L-alanine-DL-glutamate epimerase-like enolase superfamily enzyme
MGDWIDARDGNLRVPQAPGLGVDPDPALVARYRTHAPDVIRA